MGMKGVKEDRIKESVTPQMPTTAGRCGGCGSDTGNSVWVLISPVPPTVCNSGELESGSRAGN